MHPSKALLSSGTAAALTLALMGSALAQQTTPPDTATPPATTTPANSRYVQCNTATPNESTGTAPASANGSGQESASANGGVDSSTTANSSTQQVQPCAHETRMKMTAPASPSNGMSTGSGSNMDALNNNPNGSNWLDKFNRPNIATTTEHPKTHRVKRASGGGGGGQ